MHGMMEEPGSYRNMADARVSYHLLPILFEQFLCVAYRISSPTVLNRVDRISALEFEILYANCMALHR